MFKKTNKTTVFSPAKVNLYLSIKNRRLDGFHNLESVFLAVNFGDFLHFQPIKRKKTTEIIMKYENTGKNGLISASNNIILVTDSMFRDKTGYDQGLKITVNKQIPIGGGLGGGSSNAAATLLALNKIAGFPLNRNDLLGIGASIGSDVPFFLHETAAAYVTGRGENIVPMDAPCLNLVLVNPGFSSNTANAFKLLSEYRKSSNYNPALSVSPPTKQYYDIKFWDKMGNDFLQVFPEKEKTIYQKILSSLRELGAEYVNLSGAGSTCFGVFSNKEQAQRATKVLHSSQQFVQECQTFSL
jgi:4-diphosphocytidyl-2-C-methyl-D-erythritol kinase